MIQNRLFNDVSFETPALNHIRLKGHIADQMSDQLGGMVITPAFSEETQPMTTLVGEARDQAALSGAQQSG